MKKDIHPKYSDDCQVTCVCGDTMTTGSVEKEIKVELCSSCHPFYTGKQQIISTTGRVDNFNSKFTKFQDSKRKSSEKSEKPEKVKKIKKVEK